MGEQKVFVAVLEGGEAKEGLAEEEGRWMRRVRMGSKGKRMASTGRVIHS
jgi:hypothetical protein